MPNSEVRVGACLAQIDGSVHARPCRCNMLPAGMIISQVWTLGSLYVSMQSFARSQRYTLAPCDFNRVLLICHDCAEHSGPPEIDMLIYHMQSDVHSDQHFDIHDTLTFAARCRHFVSVCDRMCSLAAVDRDARLQVQLVHPCLIPSFA